MTLETKRLNRLYELLKQMQDPDTAAALTWAIHTAEAAYHITASTWSEEDEDEEDEEE